MRLNPRVVSSAAAIAITCAVTAAAYFYKNRTIQLNEVMVFCKLQYNAYSCFDKLMSYIEAAKTSVSVCMPGIQNPAIQGRLIKLMKEKNIKVRIIIDRTGCNEANNFLLTELIDAGAEIKCNTTEPDYKMRHKFCLVDDKILMTGTLNWGNDLSSDHWNYVYITNKLQLVEPVRKEFYQIWNEFNQFTSETVLSDVQPPSDNDTDTDPDSVCDHGQCEVPEPPTFRETVTTPEVTII